MKKEDKEQVIALATEFADICKAEEFSNFVWKTNWDEGFTTFFKLDNGTNYFGDKIELFFSYSFDPCTYRTRLDITIIECKTEDLMVKALREWNNNNFGNILSEFVNIYGKSEKRILILEKIDRIIEEMNQKSKEYINSLPSFEDKKAYLLDEELFRRIRKIIKASKYEKGDEFK